MGRVECAPQSEPGIEVSVVKEGLRTGNVGNLRYLGAEAELKIEEFSGIYQGGSSFASSTAVHLRGGAPQSFTYVETGIQTH
jgi:hypothetical protein